MKTTRNEENYKTRLDLEENKIIPLNVNMW